jgi:hypothetical protein
MTAYAMDRKVEDIERVKYWAAQGYHFDPDVMSAPGIGLEVQRRKLSQQ